MSINIAIDGPAGAGKSSISREAAKRLGYIYADTGALYRTIGLAAVKNGFDPKDSDNVIKLLPRISLNIGFIEDEQRVFLDGVDVSEEIRLPQISMAASDVSAVPAVREYLFDLQLKLADENNVIMDGRDIGTVVLPNADVKIFLTASPEIRARRRLIQLQDKGNPPPYNQILEEIIERDYNDSNRKIAPLKKADDAILLDTSEYTKEESIDAVVKIICEKVSDTQCIQ